MGVILKKMGTKKKFLGGHKGWPWSWKDYKAPIIINLLIHFWGKLVFSPKNFGGVWGGKKFFPYALIILGASFRKKSFPF